MKTKTEPPHLRPTVRLGVSACLLGQNVRYDGGHKRDRFLIDTLGPRVQWVPVCPEMAIGLGVPRESVRLVETKTGLRMIAPKSGKDHTDAMATWAAAHVEELARARLHGFVLKKDSPSCGLFRVKVRRENGYAAARNGRGLFATALVARFKLLPVEEEGRLEDMKLRENFVERVFVYERWTRLLDETPTPRALVAFHAAHKMTLLAHSPKTYPKLGRLVARAGAADWDDVSTRYGDLLMETMSVLATRGRHVNALQHLAGFVADAMSRADRAELDDSIADYRAGHVPLVVPLTVLRHHLRRHDAPAWAMSQTYLDPYPKEWMLRNHV